MTRAELETVWAPRLLGVLRIVAAILFMEHGAQKLLGFPPPSHGMPELFTLLWFAGVLELVGGFFLLIGLFTRPVAFLLSGQMAVAYWMAHAPQSRFPAMKPLSSASCWLSSGTRLLSQPAARFASRPLDLFQERG